MEDYWALIHFSATSAWIVKLLLEHGAESADLGTANDGGETPYQVSLRKGHVKTCVKIAYLIREYGADRARIENILYNPNTMSESDWHVDFSP